jgi:ribosome-associated translation inhibitor RaiA
MRLQVAIKGIDDKSALHNQAQERVAAALTRFQNRIRSVIVLLEDVTGPHKQSVDKRCRIDVGLKRGGKLTIDELGTDVLGSLGLAIDRLKPALSRKIGRMKWGVGAG